MKNVSFYKFVILNDLKNLKSKLLRYCKKNNLRGKILIANEGINGYLTGTEIDIENFKNYLRKYSEFSDIYFKDNPITSHTFKRMLVKIRKEIITFKVPVNMNKVAPHLKPIELKRMYEDNENFVIIDTRNDYEYDVGHFKNAIKLNTKEFSEFPLELERIKDKISGKKIVTYCTGGIRCEKATSYMLEKGFQNVYQLDGGIINYGIECGNKFWEGKCFVFDERGAVDLDPKVQETQFKYSQCSLCYIPDESKHTCPNCGKEFIMCSKCLPLMDKCCSKFCRNKLRTKKQILVN